MVIAEGNENVQSHVRKLNCTSIIKLFFIFSYYSCNLKFNEKTVRAVAGCGKTKKDTTRVVQTRTNVQPMFMKYNAL
jgi:hypothetical protein